MFNILAAKLAQSPLSEKAWNSSLQDFASRVLGAVVGVPLGGYLLGLLASRFSPGEISWPLALTLLGLAFGCGYLWYWVRRT